MRRAAGVADVAVVNFWIALTLNGIGWNFMFVAGSTLVTKAYAPSERTRAQAANDFLVFQEQRLAAGGLDVTREEPLPPSSPLWSMANVLITPHMPGETQRIEEAVIDLLMENLARRWRGETVLKNQIV